MWVVTSTESVYQHQYKLFRTYGVNRLPLLFDVFYEVKTRYFFTQSKLRVNGFHYAKEHLEIFTLLLCRQLYLRRLLRRQA